MQQRKWVESIELMPLTVIYAEVNMTRENKMRMMVSEMYYSIQ